MSEDIEYEGINFDGLERRANYRVIAYREDMLHIFERRDAAAILYHIIYRWETEYRRSEILKEIERRKKLNLAPLSAEDVENMMWVYMSYNDFVRESGHAIGYNTVIRTLDYLIHDIKVFEQRPNHDSHYPDYEYRINKKVVKSLLKKLPAEPAFSPKIPKRNRKSTQMGTDNTSSTQTGTPDNSSTQTGTQSTQTGIATTHMGRGVYPNGGISQITHSNTQGSTEEGEIATSNEDRNAPALIDFEEKRQRRGDTDKHKAVKIGENTNATPTLPADIPDSPGSSTGNDTSTQEQEESQSPPGASSQRHAEKAAGQSELEPPKMALTARQIKAQNEKREKELWAIIEAERNTKYTATQRKLYENAEGMKCLIADDISDETIRDGLQALDAFQRKSFTVLKFYGWLPNLSAKAPIPIEQQQKKDSNVGVSGLPRLARRQVNYGT